MAQLLVRETCLVQGCLTEEVLVGTQVSGRRWELGVVGWGGGKFLTQHCNHYNDSCIEMDSGESHLLFCFVDCEGTKVSHDQTVP